MTVIHKTSEEEFTIWVDFGKGALPKSQTLESATMTATDDLGVDASSVILATTFGVINSGRYVLIPLSRGVAGRAYDVKIVAVTAAGQRHQGDIRVRVTK